MSGNKQFLIGKHWTIKTIRQVGIMLGFNFYGESRNNAYSITGHRWLYETVTNENKAVGQPGMTSQTCNLSTQRPGLQGQLGLHESLF